MIKVKNLVIGFGKAGKSLASFLSKKNEEVVLIEKDSQMYGGTCINVACIPSKSLETNARLSNKIGGSFEEKALRYTSYIEEKSALTSLLRNKNYKMLIDARVKVVDGTASFLSSNEVKVVNSENKEEIYQAERIFINTGSRPFLPPIPGLKEAKNVYVSETMMGNKTLPQHLLVLGGGYIGLEFASYYSNFGSKVTVIQDGHDFIPREDKEIAEEVEKSFVKRGINIIRDAKVSKVTSKDDELTLELTIDGKEETITGDCLLVATGRRPNTQDLNLDKAGIMLNDRGAIDTDEHKRTNVKNIWAMGDVSGGLQFTYISFDDFRVVSNDLYGDGSATTENRGAIPYTFFIDPPLSRVGLSEEEAKRKGIHVGVGILPVGAIPKARVLNETTGLFKVIIDLESNVIVGAHLFGAESHELINLIKFAMDQQISYKVLRDNIYNHPTMTESFNDLFKNIIER